LGETLSIFLPIRSIDSVQIWLIFTHERFGNFKDSGSRVKGNPAR
jgi:hypothetical protein